MGRRRAISGKIVVLLILIAAAAGPATIYAYLNLIPHATDSILMTGSLRVNGHGQAEGGSGYSATYNASLSAKSGSGSLNLTLVAGDRDLLLQHQYRISDLIANDTAVSLLLDGQRVMLELITNDSSGGNQFSGSFVALGGPNEQMGTISPSNFGGLGSQYDVELRLIPVASPQPTYLQVRSFHQGG